MTPPALIGLTGGIGSGKSTVADCLREMGVAVMDADQLSRVVMAVGGSAYARVVDAFGPQILAPGGEIDRKSLGAIVFADSEKRRLLESITHPAIAAESASRVQQFANSGHPVVVYEAALLVETARHQLMAALIVVVADDELRLGRVCRRDNISPEEAAKRLASQLEQEAKAKLADYLIDNSGSLEQTQAQVRELWPKLLAGLEIAGRNE
jgi:dephospho-CoA kinase